ncbi:MAG: ribonuclease HII [Alphaproteobacteria bacterium]|jgi:ribonuclease HII|nr:ribonuclease HII [Alphaproteobacteria bacterium]
MKDVPNFNIEREINKEFIAGVDEAGRGPLCGPVVAAAVIFKSMSDKMPLIMDSKKMNHRERQIAFDWIMENCFVGIGKCDPNEIDSINILQASMLAMKRAIDNLPKRPNFVLIDGNRLPQNIIGRAIVKGDSKSLSIAAASIIAKETRDKIMQDLALLFPQYGWEKNAGYPTPEHLRAIKEFGINEHYRKSFKPIKDLL